MGWAISRDSQQAGGPRRKRKHYADEMQCHCQGWWSIVAPYILPYLTLLSQTLKFTGYSEEVEGLFIQSVCGQILNNTHEKGEPCFLFFSLSRECNRFNIRAVLWFLITIFKMSNNLIMINWPIVIFWRRDTTNKQFWWRSPVFGY